MKGFILKNSGSIALGCLFMMAIILFFPIAPKIFSECNLLKSLIDANGLYLAIWVSCFYLSLIMFIAFVQVIESNNSKGIITGIIVSFVHAALQLGAYSILENPLYVWCFLLCVSILIGPFILAGCPKFSMKLEDEYLLVSSLKFLFKLRRKENLNVKDFYRELNFLQDRGYILQIYSGEILESMTSKKFIKKCNKKHFSGKTFEEWIEGIGDIQDKKDEEHLLEIDKIFERMAPLNKNLI